VHAVQEDNGEVRTLVPSATEARGHLLDGLRRNASELVQQRVSRRTFDGKPLPRATRTTVNARMARLPPAPFGTSVRFRLATATEEDPRALRGLGTYGFILRPVAFLVGAVARGPRGLEDYGFVLECAILHLTDLGLDSCWLGGSFQKSRFARWMGVRSRETVPAVVALGKAASAGRVERFIASRVKARSRLGWDEIFFDGAYGVPLHPHEAEAYALPLELVRLAPSASNLQPWRIVREGRAWHVFLERTPGYKERWIKRLRGMADLQRIDVGVAMCHFTLGASEAGLSGTWHLEPPAIDIPAGVEYVASWHP